MAGHAGISPDVEAFEIAHPNRHAVSMIVIRPGVRSQPGFGRTVTAFAGNPLTDFESVRVQVFRDFAQRRVAGGATIIDGRVLDLQGFSNLFGTSGGQCGKGALRMKIAQRPNHELVFLPAAVTAGACAGIGAKKFGIARNLIGAPEMRYDAKKNRGDDPRKTWWARY